MTLREKIEGLTKYKGAGRWQPGGPMVVLADVLRIVAKHEQECAETQDKIERLESDLRMARDDWEAMRSTASAEYKGWKMFRGTHEGALHSHRCDTCGFTWQHSASQVSRMGAAGKARAHRCQNCGAMQRFVDDAEPEQQTAPPVGQAGGEPYRAMSSVNTGLRAVHEAWEDMAGDVVRVFALPDRMIRPRGATWAEVEQMARQREAAEVPRWRRELERAINESIWGDDPEYNQPVDNVRAYRDGLEVLSECEPHARYWWQDTRGAVWPDVIARLWPIEELRRVIESGQGQAVVPVGLKRLILPPEWALDVVIDMTYRNAEVRDGLRSQGLDAPSFLAALNRYGDSLCGAARSFRGPSAAPGDEGGGHHGA